jgi:hypothetical protein
VSRGSNKELLEEIKSRYKSNKDKNKKEAYANLVKALLDEDFSELVGKKFEPKEISVEEQLQRLKYEGIEPDEEGNLYHAREYRSNIRKMKKLGVKNPRLVKKRYL